MLRTFLNDDGKNLQVELKPVEYKQYEETDTSVLKMSLNEFIAYEIKDLFGINIIEFMSLNIIEHRVMIESAKSIQAERKRIKEESVK